MKKLVIDRQRWLRGEGVDESYLLRKHDCKMCCLGFYCLLLDLTPEEIVGKTTPAQLDVEIPSALHELVVFLERVTSFLKGLIQKLALCLPKLTTPPCILVTVVTTS